MCNINSVLRSICACACVFKWMMCCSVMYVTCYHESAFLFWCVPVWTHPDSHVFIIQILCVLFTHESFVMLRCFKYFLNNSYVWPLQYIQYILFRWVYLLYRIVFVLLYCSVSVSQRKMRGSWVWLFFLKRIYSQCEWKHWIMWRRWTFY